MSKVIQWMLELDVLEGQLETAKELITEMVSATKADEPGALAYEWFITDDNSAIHIYERYADNAAAMVHMGNFGTKFADRMLSMLKPTRIYCYGTPSQELRDTLSVLGPVWLGPIDGFSR